MTTLTERSPDSMNSANRRSALAALDTGRPIVARLDITRDPEDVAADIIDAWHAAETALRSLVGGSALTGQALVRELRQRELLSLDEAHALLEFLAARERVERTSYRPTSADIAAAREGFQKLEARLATLVDGELPSYTASAPTAGPAPATSEPVPDYVPKAAVSQRGPGLALAIILLLAIGLGVGGYLVLSNVDWSFGRAARQSAALDRGIAAYAAGRREEAEGEFTKAVRDDPGNALPHVYLARIAREKGDLVTASRELDQAIRLEPASAVAQREMGSFLLATGKPDLARKFYIRAAQLDPEDRSAQGYLACALTRLGRTAEAQRFLARAGSGPWTACAAAPTQPAGAAGPATPAAARTP
jgi:tetratricopeptide (TPR) repeat protein